MEYQPETTGTLGSNYEISNPPLPEWGSAGVQSRVKRYALQNTARDLLPRERVSWCLRRMVPETNSVDVLYSERVHRAHYGNLIRCGSVWVCPVCASKISERRRGEVERALRSGVHRSVFMVTFTLQHQQGDSLKGLLDALQETARCVKRGNPWKRFCERNGILAYVTGLEVTHGLNGWHPHQHVLFFSSREEHQLDTDAIHAFLAERFQRILRRTAGGYSHPVHGVNVRIGDMGASNYLAKWGASQELTKGTIKKANHGHSPFQLLELAGRGKAWAGDLFKEFASTMKGRRFLVWSHGARELFRLGEEITDEQLVEKEEEPAVVLVSLNKAQWKKVLGNDIRAELLEVGSRGNVQLVWGFLSGFGITPARYQQAGEVVPVVG